MCYSSIEASAPAYMVIAESTNPDGLGCCCLADGECWRIAYRSFSSDSVIYEQQARFFWATTYVARSNDTTKLLIEFLCKTAISLGVVRCSHLMINILKLKWRDWDAACVCLWTTPWLKVEPYFESKASLVQYSNLKLSLQGASQTDIHPNDGDFHYLYSKPSHLLDGKKGWPTIDIFARGRKLWRKR